MSTTFGLLSNAHVNTEVWHTIPNELEEVAAESLSAVTFEQRARRVSLYRGTPVRRFVDPIPPVKVSKNRHVDVMVIVCGSIFPLLNLELVPRWRSLADRWVAVVLEAWPSGVERHARALSRILRHFDQVLVSLQSGATAMAELSPSVRFQPHGVDVLAVSQNPSWCRPISVHNPGRRDAAQHDVLKGATRGRLYLYDSFAPGRPPSLTAHRRAYLERCSLSRMMVVNAPKFDSPHETGPCSGFDHSGRIAEALATGALPIGDHPAIPPDAKWLTPDLFGPRLRLGVRDQPDGLADLINSAHGPRLASIHGPLHAARHLDWAYHLVQICNGLRVAQPSGLKERLDDLQRYEQSLLRQL